MERLRREASIAMRLEHLNVCRILRIGETADRLTYLVMPYLPGEPLSEVEQRQGPFPLAEGIAILVQMCRGLQHAHALHIVHRDLKPENVMLVPDETAPFGRRAVVMDFGLAKERRAGPELAKLTQTGIVLGTPEFMSPEQIRGRPLDGRSDVYATGVLSFELFTGTLPFSGKNAQEMMVARLRGLPRRLRELRPDLSGRLDSVVNRALALAPDDRYQSMEALARAFEDCLEGGVLARIITSMRRRP
jgi:serine/threonine-protein kinase